MSKKYLDYDGLLYFWQKLKAYFVPQTRTVNNKALSADITLTASDVSALPDSTVIPSAGTGSSYPTMDGTRNLGSNAGFARVDHVHPSDTSRVPTSRTVNGHALSSNITLTASDVSALPDSTVIPTLQNVFGIVKVGTISIEADTTRDTLTLEAGSNVTLTPDATNDKVTISATDTTYNTGTASDISTGTSTTAKVWTPKVLADEYASVMTGATNYTDDKINLLKGAANGLCPLDGNSKVDSSYLPSYVDDVVEAYPRSGATELSASWLSTTSGGSALTPETGVIYILMADSTSYSANSQFRWSGTTYVKLSDGGVSAITNGEIDIIVAS